MSVASIIETMTTMLNQIKLFHWTTSQYSTHVALDELHTKLASHVDKFVESFIGHYKKQSLDNLTITTKVTSDVSKVSIDKNVEGMRETLRGLAKMLSKESSLVNVIDDMLTDLDQTLYLLRLS